MTDKNRRFKTASIHDGEATGFHMTFENKWTVSVQWSPERNYCDETTAEIAAWFGEGKDQSVDWYPFETDVVSGHISPEQAADFISLVSNLPAERIKR